FFFSRRRRHTRFSRDWSSDVCSSDLGTITPRFLSRTIGKIISVIVYVLLTIFEKSFPSNCNLLYISLVTSRFSSKSSVLKTLERSEERRVGKEYTSKV